jgi:uncharacterized membrane protein
MRPLRFGESGKTVLTLLAFASWLLLGVSWVMSVYAYHRLPNEMALWISLWTSPAAWSARSLAFFVYPVFQTAVFLAFLALARVVFFRAPGLGSEDRPPSKDRDGRLLALKKEVAYLGLIFLNLVFIHLQTSLILVSHGLAEGINRFYFVVLIFVLLMLIPYYRVRRQMLRAGFRQEE